MDYLDYFDLCIVNTKVVDSIRFLSISPSRYWVSEMKVYCIKNVCVRERIIFILSINCYYFYFVTIDQ